MLVSEPYQDGGQPVKDQREETKKGRSWIGGQREGKTAHSFIFLAKGYNRKKLASTMKLLYIPYIIAMNNLYYDNVCNVREECFVCWGKPVFQFSLKTQIIYIWSGEKQKLYRGPSWGIPKRKEESKLPEKVSLNEQLSRYSSLEF